MKAVFAVKIKFLAGLMRKGTPLIKPILKEFLNPKHKNLMFLDRKKLFTKGKNQTGI